MGDWPATTGCAASPSHLGTQDFVRVRIGVGKPPSKEHGAGHVLSKLSSRQKERYDVAVQEAADAVELIVTESPDAAMREYNARQLPEAVTDGAWHQPSRRAGTLDGPCVWRRYHPCSAMNRR